MRARLAQDLPSTPIAYASAALGERLRRGERVESRYDARGLRILEAACLVATTPDAAWGAALRFPELWSRLATTGGVHSVDRSPGSARDIDVGNVVRADAIVLGLPFPMRNVVTSVVDGCMFHMSVRALGGRFESEVEARIDPWPDGTLLVWRQAYPEGRLLSRLTSRVFGRREADETARILDLWAAESRAPA